MENCNLCGKPIQEGQKKADVVGPEVYHDTCFSTAWNALDRYFMEYGVAGIPHLMGQAPHPIQDDRFW